MLRNIFSWVIGNADQLKFCAVVPCIIVIVFGVSILFLSRWIKKEGQRYISNAKGGNAPSADPYSAYYFYNATRSKSSHSTFADLNIDIFSCVLLILLSLFYFSMVCFIAYASAHENEFPNIAYVSFIENISSLALSAILGVLALVTILTSFNRVYGAAVSNQEFLAAIQFWKRVMISIATYVFGILFDLLDVALERFFVNSQNITLYRIFFSLYGFCCFFVSGSTAIYMAIKMIKTIFYEDENMMNQLHYRVHHAIRSQNEFLNQTNKASINACFGYLWNIAEDGDKQHISENFINYKIRSVSYIDKFDELQNLLMGSIKKRIIIFLTLITGGLSFGICVALKYSLSACAFGAIWSIVVNIVFIKMSAKYCTDFRNFYIQASFGVWGFICTNRDGKIVVFDMHKRPFVKNKAWGKEEQNYLCCIYNIISFFRDALCADIEAAAYILALIKKNVDSKRCGYILYAVCVHMLHEAYPHEACTKEVIKDFRETMKTVKINKDIFVNNVSEIARDVMRTDDKPRCAYLFPCKVRRMVNKLTPSHQYAHD